MPAIKTRKRARCQCSSTCKSPALPNSPFCSKHIKFCPSVSRLTGYEPKFNPDKYNKSRRMREPHNCFAYAFDYVDLPSINDCNESNCPVSFPQPGRASGYPRWSKVKDKRCPDLMARLFGDIPGIKTTTFEGKCPGKSSKIALVADEDEDYHFYRQDSNGYWSHKPGATQVTHLDATGRPIYNPQLASRKYESSKLDYDSFCGYLCAPKDRKLKFSRAGGSRKTRKNNRK
jgi:hypothetical protein